MRAARAQAHSPLPVWALLALKAASGPSNTLSKALDQKVQFHASAEGLSASQLEREYQTLKKRDDDSDEFTKKVKLDVPNPFPEDKPKEINSDEKKSVWDGIKVDEKDKKDSLVPSFDESKTSGRNDDDDDDGDDDSDTLRLKKLKKQFDDALSNFTFVDKLLHISQRATLKKSATTIAKIVAADRIYGDSESLFQDFSDPEFVALQKKEKQKHHRKRVKRLAKVTKGYPSLQKAALRNLTRQQQTNF